MKIRRRPPKEAPDTIRIHYATVHGFPDWHGTWHSEADRATLRLCLMKISELGEELIKRGYDPYTLRFQVKHPGPK